ncbi:MAG TPA: hypothetical protein VHD33_08245, partial [Legionellaceae bacterium]|nr:hypothetical protein [Legionellaceae bacterium]
MIKGMIAQFWESKNQPVALCIFISLFLCSCADNESASTFQGYVEGEFVYVSSPIGGRLDYLKVRRGQTIKEKAPLFALES